MVDVLLLTVELVKPNNEHRVSDIMQHHGETRTQAITFQLMHLVIAIAEPHAYNSLVFGIEQ